MVWCGVWLTQHGVNKSWALVQFASERAAQRCVELLGEGTMGQRVHGWRVRAAQEDKISSTTAKQWQLKWKLRAAATGVGVSILIFTPFTPHREG